MRIIFSAVLMLLIVLAVGVYLWFYEEGDIDMSPPNRNKDKRKRM